MLLLLLLLLEGGAALGRDGGFILAAGMGWAVREYANEGVPATCCLVMAPLVGPIGGVSFDRLIPFLRFKFTFRRFWKKNFVVFGFFFFTIVVSFLWIRFARRIKLNIHLLHRLRPFVTRSWFQPNASL